MLVADFLEHSADRFPDKTALICDGERLSYLQIEEFRKETLTQTDSGRETKSQFSEIYESPLF
jgi:non-ribosomal peptide synthetase component E (peptide arylation enzyme)